MAAIGAFLLGALVAAWATSTQSQVVRVVEKAFDVYWNVPTFQCRGKGVLFEALTAKHGIVANRDDAFKGDRMVIMYDPGNFPAILADAESGHTVLRNGGVPQAGNLTRHLDMFEAAVERDFPDEDYDGVAVIDFESWRPIYRQNWGALRPYQHLSVDVEAELHPTWTLARLRAAAERRFEVAGRQYVEETLRLAKRLRPNARWGYYGYPHCFNMQAPHYLAACGDAMAADNDRSRWLHNASDSLHPSLYLPEAITADQRIQLMEGRIFEAVRVQNQFEAATKKIYPYFWLVYRDTKHFVGEEDLLDALALLRGYQTDGLIIWGSSNDVNTKAKCEQLYAYVDDILGPALRRSRLA